jgi:hypothetical protein
MLGKWFLLICYTLLSNVGSYWLWGQNKVFLVGDVMVKLGIVFMTGGMNKAVEKSIIGMHFERVIEYCYRLCIQYLSNLYCGVTKLLMGIMREDHQSIFKTSVVNTL